MKNHSSSLQQCAAEFEAYEAKIRQELEEYEKQQFWKLINTMKSSANLSLEDKRVLFKKIRSGEPPYSKFIARALYSELCSKHSSSSS